MTATHAACLTSPGNGAIAVVAINGPDALACVRPHFSMRRGSLPEVVSAPVAFVGSFRLDDTVSDEVVLVVVASAWVEVQCHGGPLVVAAVLAQLSAAGATIVAADELCRLHGAGLIPDTARARAAAVLLPRATTARTAQILLDQVNGATPSAESAQWTSLGRHLVDPWQVVIAGPPNAGKSSLINALAGYERCVVAPQPGTTRDVVTTTLALGGWPVNFSDTAGLRDTAHAIEVAGIARARSALATADLVLWLTAADEIAVTPPADIRVPVLWAVNKCDLPAVGALPVGALAVSVRTGMGLAELAEAVLRQLVPSEPPAGTSVPMSGE